MNFKIAARLIIICSYYATSMLSAATTIEDHPELSQVFNNFVEDDELAKWEAPDIIKKLYSAYYAGNDDENRPIWIGELGKWDIRLAVEQGGEFFDSFDRHVDQISQRIVHSMVNNSSPDMPVTQLLGIVDMEGYSMRQLSSVKTVAYVLRKVRQLEPIIRCLETGYVINANYVAEMIINLVRPILGPTMERIEIHGTNKAKWMPRIIKKFPKETLPEWYGGSKDFQPLQVYG